MTREELRDYVEFLRSQDEISYDVYYRLIDGIDTLEQEPCEDCISRQAVLDIIRFEDKWLLDAKGHNADTEIAFSGLKSRIADLPPVNPQEPKTGHWIEKEGWDGDLYYECSVCGELFCLIDGTPTDNMYNFCPNCGAKMVESHESEE